MKKIGLYPAVLLLLTACGRPSENVITGTVEGLKAGDRVILAVESPEGSGYVAVDSALVEKDGEFTLRTKVTDSYVRLARLRPGERFDPVNTGGPLRFLEGYSRLTVTGDTIAWYYLRMEGGLYGMPEMQEINRLTDSARNMQREGRDMRKAARQNGDTALLSQGGRLIREANRIFDAADSLEGVFAAAHPDAAFSAAVLRYDHRLRKDLDAYEAAYLRLTPRVRATPAGELVGKYIESVKATRVGAAAPGFTLESADGKAVSLSDFKGQYVLLDFWGSWCGPCRFSRPRLADAYRRLREGDASVVFLGIAWDEDNEADWKKAIAEEGLAWTQLNESRSSDGSSVRKLYAVVGVPACILVSPEGRILARKHPLDMIPVLDSLFLSGKGR